MINPKQEEGFNMLEFTLEQIVELITYISVVSMAAERMVDIIKRAVIQKYNIDTLNGALYQIMAGLFGTTVAIFSPPKVLIIGLNEYIIILVVGLAVSGGSGAWNTILNILNEISKAKKTLASDSSK